MLHPWFPKLKSYQNLEMVAARENTRMPFLIDSLENSADNPVRSLGWLICPSHGLGNIDLKFFSLLGRNFSFLIRVMN